jgi:hypothetical protein
MAGGLILGKGNGVGLGCQRKIEIALQISDSRKWDSNQKF